MKYLWMLLMCGVVQAQELPTLTADKVAGTLTVFYPDTKESKVVPALFGKVKSDRLNMDNYNIPGVAADGITPAGKYKITKMFSWRLNEPVLVFIQGTNTIEGIHPLWMNNPEQHRVERLLSVTPSDNRVTGGCINVAPDFFYSVLNNLPDGVELTILSE
jgi:hypothetical protein